ncbi:MAG: hypothetical protein ACYDCF_11205 [Burkholderiales bacterium]
MSNFGQSYGRDIRLDFNLASGVILTLPEIEDYNIKPSTHVDKFTIMSGKVKHNAIPQGGDGTIKLKRVDSTVEDFQAAFEASFFAGAAQIKGTLTETIANPDGTIKQYQCLGVVLIIEDMGTWKGETATTQQIKFHYNNFVKVA